MGLLDGRHGLHWSVVQVGQLTMASGYNGKLFFDLQYADGSKNGPTFAKADELAKVS